MVRAGQGALLWVLVCAAFTFGCKSGGDVPPPPADPNKATGVVSPESTSPVVVSLPSGATVTVPPGAVSQPTTITIEKTSTQPPGASSPLYNVGPAGTQFLQPVTISIPIPAGVSVSSGATIYLSSGTQTGTYQALPTTVTTTGSGSTATAQVGQVGSVFVGQPCAEGAACATETTCRAGSQTCVTGKPACSETGLLATDGTSCGGGQICGLGTCIAPSATGTVTASGGGTVTLPGGVVVQFPPGAIPADTVVTVNVVGGAAPPGALSPVLEFLPSMTFAQPVTVSFPIAGTPPSGTTIYWSQPGTTGAWTPHLASLSTPGVASTQVTHFSLGYVGLPCTPGDACSVASACHVGAIACTSGAPVCSDTGTGRPDGTTCGSGNTCQGGSCVTPSLVGQWKGTVPGSGVAVVTIRADGTWSRATAGGPVASGAWTVAGNLIALTDDACGAGVTGTYEYTAAAGSLVLELVSDSCSSRAAVADVVLVKSTVTLCVPGASCTPAAPIACRAYATTCDATFTQTTCSPDAFLQDGTSCGSGLVCTAGACGAPPVVIDLNGTWTGTTFTATATPPGGTAGAPVTFAAAREAIQVGSAVSFTTVSSLGSESDCTGTLSGTTVSASCTIVNLDGTCSGSYSVTAPVTPGSLATWETGDVTYTWSGFSCAQAGTVVHVPTGALAPQTAPPPDISGTYSVAIDYTRTGPSPRSPQTGTSTGTRVRTQAGNFVRSMLTTPNTTYYCYGPVIGTTVYDACNGFGADGVTTFSGRLQSTITPGSPLTISGGGSYTIHGDLAGYTNLVATAVATRTGASTCTPSQTCFPYGSANPCSTYATTCSASGVQGCAAAASQAEGTSCGSSLVCSATGTCIAACVAGSGCTPAGTADPCRTYATTCNGAGTVTTCSPATNRPDGTTCGSGLVCSIGSCVAACVAGNACTPAGTPIACRAYATTCDATGTVTSCSPAANLPDGTTCGTASICSAGTCAADSASASIGVSGGSVTTLSGARLAVPASSLDATRSFQIARSASAPPAGVAAYSPVYDLAPDGVIFARLPVVTIPIPAGVAQASIYSSRLDGTGFDALEGTVDTVAHTVSAQVGHLGQAFAGAPAATRDVVGYGITTYITPTSRANVLVDFSSSPPEILVPTGGGAYRSIPAVVGTGAAAGTVRFPNVPQGEHLLRRGTSYSFRSGDVANLGSSVAGKPISLRTALTQSSILDLAVSGMASWQVGDWLEFFSPQVNDWDFETDILADPPLQPGDVGAHLPIDVRFLNAAPTNYLIEGSKGDQAIVAQLSSATSGNGLPYISMARVGVVPSFDLPASGTTPASVVLVPINRGTVSFDWRGSQWRGAVELDGNPAHVGASPTSPWAGGDLGIYALPGLASDGYYSASADLLWMHDSTGSDAATGAMNVATAADALPGTWAASAMGGYSMPVPLLLPGTTTSFLGLNDSLRDWMTVDASQSRPFEPSLTAPVAAFVGSSHFFAGGESMGTTPTVTWTAPRVGVPTSYGLTIHEIFRSGIRTTRRATASFSTQATTLAIPPGILQPEKNYAFVLSSYASDADHSASAAIVSGIFRTSAQCVAVVACTPTGIPDPCRTYTTTCDPSLTVTTCSPTGVAPPLTTCGTAQVCNGSGQCIADVAVSVSPASASMAPGQQIAFTATVDGVPSTAVTWSVQEGAAGGTVVSGVYTAPATTGVYHVVATSTLNPLRSATATVTVAAPAQPWLSVSPPAVSATASSGTSVATTLTIANAGTGTLALPFAWANYSTGSNWITARVIGAAAPYSLVVTTRATSLPPGTYTANVEIEEVGAGNSTQIVPLTFTVTAPAIGVVVSPTAASLGYGDQATFVASVSGSRTGP